MSLLSVVKVELIKLYHKKTTLLLLLLFIPPVLFGAGMAYGLSFFVSDGGSGGVDAVGTSISAMGFAANMLSQSRYVCFLVIIILAAIAFSAEIENGQMKTEIILICSRSKILIAKYIALLLLIFGVILLLSLWSVVLYFIFVRNTGYASNMFYDERIYAHIGSLVYTFLSAAFAISVTFLFGIRLKTFPCFAFSYIVWFVGLYTEFIKEIKLLVPSNMPDYLLEHVNSPLLQMTPSGAVDFAFGQWSLLGMTELFQVLFSLVSVSIFSSEIDKGQIKIAVLRQCSRKKIVYAKGTVLVIFMVLCYVGYLVFSLLCYYCFIIRTPYGTGVLISDGLRAYGVGKFVISGLFPLIEVLITIGIVFLCSLRYKAGTCFMLAIGCTTVLLIMQFFPYIQYLVPAHVGNLLDYGQISSLVVFLACMLMVIQHIAMTNYIGNIQVFTFLNLVVPLLLIVIASFMIGYTIQWNFKKGIGVAFLLTLLSFCVGKSADFIYDDYLGDLVIDEQSLGSQDEFINELYEELDKKAYAYMLEQGLVLEGDEIQGSPIDGMEPVMIDGNEMNRDMLTSELYVGIEKADPVSELIGNMVTFMIALGCFAGAGKIRTKKMNSTIGRL